MVYSLVSISGLKRRKRWESFFYIIKDWYQIIFLINGFLLNSFFFYNAKLYFFENIYKLFKSIFTVNRFKIFKKLLFFPMNNVSLHIHLKSKFIVNIFYNYFIISTGLRNFFITFTNPLKNSYITGGCGRYYRTGNILRSKRFRNENFLKRAKKQYMQIYNRVHKYIVLIFKNLSNKLTYMTRVYAFIFRTFNTFFKVKWVRFANIEVNRCAIFGHMRGVRKPIRKRRLPKRNFFN